MASETVVEESSAAAKKPESAPADFVTGEPRSASEILAALSQGRTRSEAFFAAIETPVFFAPQGDRWSPGDHLRHLAKSVRPVAQALRLPSLLLRLRFGAPRLSGRSYPELRDAYLGRLAEGVRAGRFAPTPQAPPTDPEARREQIVANWRAANLALEAAVARWSEKGLDRTSLPHPALGRLTVREMLFFTLYHNAHHARLVAERLARGAVLVLALALLAPLAARAEATDSPSHAAIASISADAALAELKAGNQRFVALEPLESNLTAARRSELAQAQHPKAIIVGCADSRTPPELVFDQGLGDLFVLRSAGNLVDDHELGSIEYAVEHLGSRLIVVLGHERCGAVAAAVAGPRAPGHVGSLVRDIQPAVQAARKRPGELLVNAVDANVDLVAQRIRDKAKLGKVWAEVRVVEAVVDLDTGVVDWVE